MIIRDFMTESCLRYANLPAVKWLGKGLVQEERSYEALGRNIIATRVGLSVAGFTGKQIALIGTSSVEWIESYLGIVTGCSVAVPLDAQLPFQELVTLCNRSHVEGVFLSPKLKDLLPIILKQCPKVQCVWWLQENGSEDSVLNEVLSSEEASKALAQRETFLLSDVTRLKALAISHNDVERPLGSSLATILFTSGTTGVSKGVMLSQENLASNVEAVKVTADPGTVMMSVLPIHHAFCLVMDWMKGFSLGCTLCVNDSLLHMVRNMSLFQPEVMLMVPLMIETIYQKLSVALSSSNGTVDASKVFGGKLRTIFTGGAHLDPYYVEQFASFGVQVLEGYGMSECSPVISSNAEECHKVGSIGKPLDNIQIKFEDGEICVKGSSVMMGYYEMPEETAKTLQDGWLHTGDKGYLDEDGFLFINGRVKNLIILSNGENVSPEEIENKLALNPLVKEVIVTGEQNKLTAHVFPSQEMIAELNMDDQAVKQALQGCLDSFNGGEPSYRRVTGLVVRQNPFHKSATQKIKRQEVLLDD